jgi:glycosyltransferase involved in cell wall biosynthesis
MRPDDRSNSDHHRLASQGVPSVSDLEVSVERQQAASIGSASLNERPLRIAIVTETFLPKIDGIVTRLCATLQHLRRMGHIVEVIAPKGVQEFEGIPVHGIPGFKFPLYPDLKAAIPNTDVSRLLRRFQPDLIHAVNPAMLGVSAFFASTSQHVPLVVSYHTNVPKYLQYYGLGFLESLMWWGTRLGYNRADLILATSQAMQAELDKHGIRRAQLWQRGVDTELFHPKRATRQMRERLTEGHPQDTLLLYLGRLSAEKEVERCRDILAAFPQVRLALVGDGPRRHKLEEHFAGTPTHFAGFLRGADVAEALASADACYLPSRTETLGLVLLEAMAAGCPVVAPRAGGITEIVRDGVTGYLYDPNDPNAAVEAHRKLVLDAAHRMQLSRQARADTEQWGWAAATRQLEQHYRRVMTRERNLPRQIVEHRASTASVEVICEQLRISRATFRRHARPSAAQARNSTG